MKVVIAEKPSVARDIAKVLEIKASQKGFIEGRGCAVTWAFGHLVTLQEPGEYDPALKRWSLDSLPFVPRVTNGKVKRYQKNATLTFFLITHGVSEKSEPGNL